MTNWTIERGDHGAPERRPARGSTGMTLLMTTEELLAVLDDGAAAVAPPKPAAAPPRLHLVPPPEPAAPAPPAAAPAPAPPRPASRDARTLWTPPPAPVRRAGLRTRLRCVRHGHDPRPHRPLPHDEVVYRCLRCGRTAPPPAQ